MGNARGDEGKVWGLGEMLFSCEGSAGEWVERVEW